MVLIFDFKLPKLRAQAQPLYLLGTHVLTVAWDDLHQPPAYDVAHSGPSVLWHHRSCPISFEMCHYLQCEHLHALRVCIGLVVTYLVFWVSPQLIQTQILCKFFVSLITLLLEFGKSRWPTFVVYTQIKVIMLCFLFKSNL